MDEIIQLCSAIYGELSVATFPLNIIDRIWEHTLEGYTLQRFVLDSLLCCLSKEAFLEAEHASLIPHKLTVALAAEGFGSLDSSEFVLPWNTCGRSQYHIPLPCDTSSESKSWIQPWDPTIGSITDSNYEW